MTTHPQHHKRTQRRLGRPTTMTQLRALTVQQPWAWAIIHGGKTIENRTQNWSHRGPLLIHAGARLSERGCDMVPDLLDQTRPDLLAAYAEAALDYSAIIGVVDLVDVHHARGELWNDSGSGMWDRGCCTSRWAEQEYEEHGGRVRRQLVHLVLENPQPIDPIPCAGRLGLWTPTHDILEQLPAGAL